jgi:hypothetical protein
MKSYSVYFHGSANQGSRAIDAIAITAHGDWTSSTDNFAIVTVEDENAEYLEELLDQDERVESYRER